MSIVRGFVVEAWVRVALVSFSLIFEELEIGRQQFVCQISGSEQQC